MWLQNMQDQPPGSASVPLDGLGQGPSVSAGQRGRPAPVVTVVGAQWEG